jgi:hypothetical protein
LSQYDYKHFLKKINLNEILRMQNLKYYQVTLCITSPF